MKRSAEILAVIQRHARMAACVLLAGAGLVGQAQAAAPGAADGCAAGALPVPAAGYAVAARSSSKSDAILGGAQSRFALIKAQQANLATLPDPPSAEQAAAAQPPPLAERYGLPVFAPRMGLGLPFLPAGFQHGALWSRPPAPVAARPSFEPGCAGFARRPETGGMPAFAPRADSPDVFGSVAIAVSRTPFDANWRRVRAGGLGAGPWSAVLRAARSADRAGQLALVNHWVNARIAFVDDTREYGVADHWATAQQSLARRRGDCEDYAIAKHGLLRSLGVPASDLYLVIARDLVRRADHAVLAVRVGGRIVILDNETDRILDAEQVRDYRPVMSYAGERSWTHGYRVNPVTAPIRTAMAGLPAGR